MESGLFSKFKGDTRVEETEARLVVEQRTGFAVIFVEGEIDMANVYHLEAALLQADTGHGDIVIEMSGVGYMDSSGFAALLECARRLRVRGSVVHLTGCGNTIRRLLDVTRLNIIFRLHPDLASAESELNVRRTRAEDTVPDETQNIAR
jgi:anti-sigma B factor antagonist